MSAPPPAPQDLVDGAREADQTKGRKACINCRRQKMKCRIEDGTSCRRCLRAEIPCIFVPRANSAAHKLGLAPRATSRRQVDQPSSTNDTILQRLARLEQHLGLDTVEAPVAPASPSESELQSPEQDSLGEFWQTAGVLERNCSARVNAAVWERPIIKQLWLTFHENMPSLHFLPGKQTFTSPKPVILASVLYCSSLLGRVPAAADLAPDFLTVLCNTIAQLCVPDGEISQIPADPTLAEEWAFQTVLGIIIAGLLREAVNKETGLWIALAYRLVMEHCATSFNERLLEWRRLWSGLQIVDLEHASLHLSCPVTPIEAPIPRLQVSPRDQLYRLSRMMHVGLTHFTGRGLPTIWSYFVDKPAATRATEASFSPVDSAVIRDWARQLDEWLLEFNEKVYDSEHEKKLIFRQYILHQLLVLSIYHAVRGCDLFSNTTPNERHELLASARAAVKLQVADTSIWANWDLVMITWAALIVLQGIRSSVGEVGDLEIVRFHLEKLREPHSPQVGIREILATRLEQRLNDGAIHMPVADGTSNLEQDMNASIDTSWYLFDQSSLQAGYDLWSCYGQVP